MAGFSAASGSNDPIVIVDAILHIPSPYGSRFHFRRPSYCAFFRMMAENGMKLIKFHNPVLEQIVRSFENGSHV